MPRGRPKKEPVESGGGDVAAPLIRTPDDAAFSIEIPGGPPSKIKGEWNPDYFATKILRAANLYEQATLIDGGKSDFNVESYTKWVLAAAKVCQIDERDVRDRRTTLQRAEDLYKSIKADANVLLEADDDDLIALDEVLAVTETRMNDADEMCKAYLKSGLDDLEEANARSPKSWRLRIKRILNLRMRARNPIPACSFRGNQRTETAAGAAPYPGLIKAALEAAHPLRFMLYVGRSSMDTAKRFTRKRMISEADKVFLIGRHHAKMVCDTWEARNGVMFAIEDGMKVIKRGVIPYSGVMLVIPPGHGKTEAMSHYDALEVCLRPNTMGVILHAVEDEASKILVYIQNLFKKDNPAGKRCGALFDRPLAKKGNNSFHFRLAGNHGKSATFRASGVMSARLGSDTTIQHLDDVVPQADAHEETERVKRCDVIAGTWATRQRGQNVFRIITCTLWHHADANMQIINQARLAARTNGQQGMIFRISIQKCGGPDKNPQKAFEPLWPEVYDRFELRSFYNNLKPRLYSAAYQSNPLSDEQKIVKKLRIYDPETPEHEAFIKSSVKYISLDPAATKESKSDKAGILYAGVGDVRVTREIDGVQTTDTETRVRFFFAHEIHATQSDLTEYVCGFALNKPVDYVLSEAVAGFKGIIEMFQGRGIDAIPLHPKGKSKESRLRGVAPLLEDASAELGFRAIAEFPGIRNERGELILHPMFNGLSEQILEFGVCADDHILDACTQLLGYVAPDVGVGRGVVSEQAKAQERVSRDPRLAAIVSRLMKGKDEEGGSVEREESQWISRNWQ